MDYHGLSRILDYPRRQDYQGLSWTIIDYHGLWDFLQIVRLYQDQESIERGFYSNLPIASVSDDGCSEGGNHD